MKIRKKYLLQVNKKLYKLFIMALFEKLKLICEKAYVGHEIPILNY